MEHRQADVVSGRGSSGDDEARFLSELRKLRDGAGLGHAELAARAHFPYDSIRAAEVGPALPDLPVLSAFVRGCGGTTEEWEERWRSLTKSPSLPVAEMRPTGRSDAATAGARIGSVGQAGDAPDPSVILAALNRVAEEMASPSLDPLPASAAAPGDDVASASFPSASGPETGAKSTGWDPIRVSTAWPAIRDTPKLPEDTGSSGAASVPSAAPWGTATPWAKDTANGAGATRRPSAAGSAADGKARGSSSSLTKIVVIAAVLLCVIAVLLVVFS